MNLIRFPNVAFVWSRLVAIFLVVVVATSCSSATLPEHELRIARVGDPPSLSALNTSDQDSIALDLLWCETLVGLDRDNRLIPVLVTRIPSRENRDISPDGQTITYHLRKGVRFADGVPLTSADVAFTYHAILDPTNLVQGVADYQEIRSLTTPDANTVVIRLRSRWAAAVRVLFAQAAYAYGILPKHAFTGTKILGSAWEQQPFGTGPFRVASWRRGDQIVATANPYYVSRPKLKRIVFRILPNQTTALIALQTNRFDITAFSPTNLHVVEASRAFRVVATRENGQEVILFNFTRGATRDQRVRHAIADALDLRELSKAWRRIYPISDSVFPRVEVSWRERAVGAYAHDVRRAGKELDAADWHLQNGIRERNGEPLSLSIIVSSALPEDESIAVLSQAQLRKIGIDARVKSYDPAELFAVDGPYRSGRYSFIIGGGLGGSDPETALVFGDPPFRAPRYDALFAQQHVATDDRKRERAFDDLAAIIHDDALIVPLHDLLNIEGVNVRVVGYARNMLRYPVHAETWDAH